MFSLASGIYQSYFAPPKLSILIVGLDGAGKTSLLERIKVTDVRAKLDADAGGSAHLEGGAVAGAGGESRSTAAGDRTRPPQRRREEGGRPARLPPPLPPKDALRSARFVERALEDGFDGPPPEESGGEGSGGLGEGDSSASAGPADVDVAGVPPPPLVSTGNSAVAAEGLSAREPQSTEPLAKAKRPPLPPRNDALKINSAKNLPEPETPTKKNSFIQLLRCPSPGKYSDAAIGTDDDDEEEVEDLDLGCDNDLVVEKDALEPWSAEYLRDYQIEYREGEEFDLKSPARGGGGGGVGGAARKMFPLDRIRPTLGQNLAKLDLCGCKCSLFDLSGAEKMRPLWDRYYRDADAVIYVVNAAETSPSNLVRSRLEYERMRRNDSLRRRVLCGLPILIFANQLDVAYKEYELSLARANDELYGRGISWNADEEDDFVGGRPAPSGETKGGGGRPVTERAIDFHDLVALFGLPRGRAIEQDVVRSGDCNGVSPVQGNVFLFGGSAKSGEGVRAAMEYLVAHAKCYHLALNAQR